MLWLAGPAAVHIPPSFNKTPQKCHFVLTKPVWNFFKKGVINQGTHEGFWPLPCFQSPPTGWKYRASYMVLLYDPFKTWTYVIKKCWTQQGIQQLSTQINHWQGPVCSSTAGKCLNRSCCRRPEVSEDSHSHTTLLGPWQSLVLSPGFCLLPQPPSPVWSTPHSSASASSVNLSRAPSAFLDPEDLQDWGLYGVEGLSIFLFALWFWWADSESFFRSSFFISQFMVFNSKL